MNKIQEMVYEITFRNGVRKCCLIVCVLLSLTFISCKKEEVKVQGLTCITSVDMEKMALYQLPGYQLQSTHISDIYGREYVYTKDLQHMFVTIGLHPSDIDASIMADRYVRDVSETMKEAEHGEFPIGDKYFLLPSGDSSGLATLVFIRKNALVILSGTPNSSIIITELAAKIDNDLQNNSTYVKRATGMTGPTYIEVQLSKSIFFEGDTAKAIVLSQDKNKEPLEYNIAGWDRTGESAFTKIINPSFIKESNLYGRPYHVTVMNKSNAIMIFEPYLHLSF